MSRAAPRLVLALGAALCALGIALFWRTNRSGSPADGGWAAYTPLPAGTAYQSRLTLSFDDDRWAVLWTAGHVVGAGLVVAGLLVLSGLTGWLLGRRRAGRRPADQR
ncbi:hypothetical protein O2W18_19795 [Modestobacter sp. VKM Ac-2983]|uniref:hypothetical protein n=1 Tax=Modestobacter sp. VKM Ac-2983 TaxID=3004137 RepID=UPI0022ABA744|nr:hypothetical protein [Modestobacter sp. VKM Ac-2983]MCZ2807355.1 hypothetical protein [Modestobacter sp. VKM Ac-2983]